MTQLENKFGIPRNQFANAVASGEDPRKLFGSAPENPLSNEDMNKATSGAKSMTDAEIAKALAGTELTAAQAELAAKFGTGAGESQFAVNPGGARGPASSRKKDTSDLEQLIDASPVEEAVPLSPELQSALQAKALEDRRNGITDLTIFQVVHLKYQEKCRYFPSYGPTHAEKGAPDAEGI
jgi:hypothetical protein